MLIIVLKVNKKQNIVTIKVCSLILFKRERERKEKIL